MTETINMQLVIVGGGPAGMAAAVSAYESGIRDMVSRERNLSEEYLSSVFTTASVFTDLEKSSRVPSMHTATKSR